MSLRNTRNRGRIGVALAALAIVTLLAPAQTKAELSALSFGFENLASHFELTGVDSGTFTAISSSTLLTLPTLGSVSRTIDPQGYAQFNWAAPGIGVAAVSLTLDLTDISQVTNSALATGTFALTDVDGQTIIGNIAGAWSLDGGFGHFDGSAFDLVFDPEVGGWFDGNIFSPGFDMDFTGFEQLLGTVVDLSNLPGQGFFDETWLDDGGESLYVESNVDSLLLIPAPGAVLLGAMGLGLIAAGRRRRAR